MRTIPFSLTPHSSKPNFARLTRISQILSGMLAIATVTAASAQTQSSDRQEGLRNNSARWHALTDVRLVISPTQTIPRGSIVFRDGKIIAFGENIAIPAGARVWSLPGRSVYAGFIDLSSQIGVPNALRDTANPAAGEFGPRNAPASATNTKNNLKGIAHQNRNVRAEIDVSTQLEINADEAQAARELGFTTVLATPEVGVFRGQSVLLHLGENTDKTDAKSLVALPRAAQHIHHDVDRNGGYPNSLMGSIALVRQTLYDAKWYAASRPKNAAEENASLAALLAATVSSNAAKPSAPSATSAPSAPSAPLQPIIYGTLGEQDYQRIDKVGREFGLNIILQGNGFEYRRMAQLKAAGLPIIVPLTYPKAPNLTAPDSGMDIALEHLQHWDQAPTNAAQLHQANVPFAITAAGLSAIKPDASEGFWQQLRQTIKHGLPPAQALAAMTTTPAKLIGLKNAGTLEIGQIANIVVASGDLFDGTVESEADAANIELTFVAGQPFRSSNAVISRPDIRGDWKIFAPNLPEHNALWSIKGTRSKPTLNIDGSPCALAVNARQISVSWPCGKAKPADISHMIVAEISEITLNGTSQKTNIANATNATSADQDRSNQLQLWSAQRVAALQSAPSATKTEPAKFLAQTAQSAWPVGAASPTAFASARNVLVRNATVWNIRNSANPSGAPALADIAIRDGKISEIALKMPENRASSAISVNTAADTLVIDASGKHVSAGLIDAHSHTAIMGNVNEPTSAITAEVRIADVIDATDINIYRQLAGGVTAANVMHGSANPMGGQNQVIKMRWGADAEGLKFIGAMPGIKFALGENVKQSNWGSVTQRYPQTRGGVEQIMRDEFQAGQYYQAAWNAYRAAPNKLLEPRRDLRLDTIVELLERKRAIHIHSYRADEILMFVELAKEFNLKVATFQHVLEGYKVADAIASIGAGGSTFTDWWAYKMEVIDAIPQNAAMMHKAGVVTTFNSDSNELARRLNTEAAKAVRYGGEGGISVADALNFVTLNAAKQLGVDGKVGSLEVGKDADFVIWSHSPLSTQAVAEQTWIEGRKYFDYAADKTQRVAAQGLREQLLAKMRAAAEKRPTDTTSLKSEVANATPTPNLLENALAQMAVQRWLHNYTQRRHDYYDGSSAHECTEDIR